MDQGGKKLTKVTDQTLSPLLPNLHLILENPPELRSQSKIVTKS